MTVYIFSIEKAKLCAIFEVVILYTQLLRVRTWGVNGIIKNEII